jgi:6-phosphogluconolactonase
MSPEIMMGPGESTNPVAQEVCITASPQELAEIAAEVFIEHVQQAVRAKGIFAVALSGGSTPKRLYQMLANKGTASTRTPIAWDKVHFFWGDERQVPPDHPDSNYRMAYETLLSKLPVPSEHVHRIHAEGPDARAGARAYEQVLTDFFGLRAGQYPRFDLVLLGLGSDGHVASLFPGTQALDERRRLVIATWVERFQVWRITLTLPVLNNAASVLFLVSGVEKAKILKKVLEPEHNYDHYPAQFIRPREGRAVWLVDEAAAACLRQPRYHSSRLA